MLSFQSVVWSQKMWKLRESSSTIVNLFEFVLIKLSQLKKIGGTAQTSIQFHFPVVGVTLATYLKGNERRITFSLPLFSNLGV